jgi:hypothetical protein
MHSVARLDVVIASGIGLETVIASASDRPTLDRHTPRMRGIQYAAASRFHHKRLWNTGSPAFAGDDDWVCSVFVLNEFLWIQFSNSAFPRTQLRDLAADVREVCL